MRPVRMLTAVVVALVLVSACGSGDGGEKSAGSQEAKASGSPSAAADADGLVTVSEQGLSLKVPAAWKRDEDTRDDTFFMWVNPKCKTCGLVALSVDNTTQSAEDYLRFSKSSRGTLYHQVQSQTTVPVEGMGRGYRLHTQWKQSTTDRVVVSTMDGLLVEVISVPDKEHPEYTDLVLASLRRDL